MLNHFHEQIEKNLAGVPDGALLECAYSSLEADEGNTHTDSIQGRGKKISFQVFPGVTVVFQTFLAEEISCRHEAESALLEINYCRQGRIGWNMKDGQSIYLGPGDFSLHTRQLCAGSVMTLPNGYYEGLGVYIDLAVFDKTPPELLCGTGITGKMFLEKFCFSGSFTTFAGNEKTEPVFSGFYDVPPELMKPYFTIKTFELLLYLAKVQLQKEKTGGKYQSEQVEIVRQVHDHLMQHMNQRITIDALARQYLMNPTTLKAVFKAVYGNSLASHMKEHRMEKAVFLLCETTDSVSQIAKEVGYSSQSRFSAAFKEVYQMLPLEYRKLHSGKNKKVDKVDFK